MSEIQERFFAQLNALGTGERAALRREAGSMLRQADGKAISAFYRCLPPAVEPWEEDRWFAVACMRCLWDPGDGSGKPVEQIVSDLLRSGEISDSTLHRIEILLDTDWDADGYLLVKLTRLIKMIRQKSDRTMVDFAALLDDLLRWNADSQSVQRKWARAVYMNQNETEIKTEEKE